MIQTFEGKVTFKNKATNVKHEYECSMPIKIPSISSNNAGILAAHSPFTIVNIDGIPIAEYRKRNQVLLTDMIFVSPRIHFIVFQRSLTFVSYFVSATFEVGENLFFSFPKEDNVLLVFDKPDLFPLVLVP